MVLMALPNEHLMTFNQYKNAKSLFAAIEIRFGGNEVTKKTPRTLLKQMYKNFSALSIESLESIFNRLQKIRNKHDLNTMSINDLYNNFKIVEQEVKGTTSSNSSSQNMDFVSSPSTNSTNEVHTTYGVSTASTQSSTASTQKSGKKVTINGSDTAGFDKSKVECYNCHKMGHFEREYRGPRNHDSRNRYQDSSRRTVHVEEIPPKAMVSINEVGFDWSYMAEDEVPTNMALMAFLDSKNDLSYSGLEEFEQYQLESYGPKSSEIESKNVSKDIPNELKKIVIPTIAKVKFVRPKQQEKPVRKLVKPKAVITARPSPAVVNAVRENQVNVVRPQHVGFGDLPNLMGNLQKVQKDQRCVNSRCSRHMTRNMSYLSNFKEFNRGYVTFGGGANGGRITNKGTIKTDNLDFEDVYFVKELKFNFFSVSQMCDRKNKFLFIDTECLVLSLNFKSPDESQILLRVPKKNNMYSVDMKNIVPKKSLTCLVAKATLDESMLWHRRLGYIKFKNINKLVKDNLVRGLPLKHFNNDQPCVACLKGKQHKASCKSKIQNSISQPLFMLHMDLFGPTFVSTLMHKKYGLVVTDDYSRYTWVFFLATKDETTCILKKFITEIENLVDKKVQVIRCDNKTEFKNIVMNDFCAMKGIKREFSVARTPYQNSVAKRRNRTLIEAARIMLADSKLPTIFWAEALNTACYVQNRALVVKSHNKNPYELFRGRIPALSFMRPFGCHVTILNTLDHLSKFDGKADEGAGPEWLFDIDMLTKSMNYVPVIVGTNSNDFEGTKDSIGADDPKMPDLEAIATYDDSEEEDDFTILESSIHVDVKSAFLYGRIKEEVYMFQPLGFEDPDHHDKVYKVVKALYGLHQAPRAWYETLAKYLLGNEFYRGKIDQTLFIKRQKGDILLVLVYVDDIIFGSTKKKLCTEFERLMKDKFQMSSMGELSFFLGLQVKQKEDGIYISHDKYVAEVLRKFNFSDVKPASTPVDMEKTLVKDADADNVDMHLYRSMIDNFRYLKGKPKLGLWYPRDSPFELVAYTDSDYAGASLDRKSTTGGCQILGSKLISWQCKKQTVVATSVTKAEYVAAASCYGQILWIQNQMLDYGYNFMHTIIYFWQTATASILDNGEMEITATIDGKVKVVIEESVRRHLKLEDSDGISTFPTTEIFEQRALMGERSTVPVESHHTPTGAPSISQQHFSPTLRIPIRQETEVPRPSSPPHTNVVDEAASTGVDVRHGGAATTVTSLDAGQGQDLEDPSKQGRKIDEIDQDLNISLIQQDAVIQGSTAEPVSTAGAAVTTASVDVSPASPTRRVSTADDITMAETLVYIRRSVAKDKAVRLARVEANEELTQRLQEEERNKYNEVDQAKMLVDLINQKKRYFAQLRGYSFNELKTLFETTIKTINTFVPMETEDKGRASELAAGSSQATIIDYAEGISSKRAAEAELDYEGSKRQKTNKASGSEQPDAEENELDDLVMLWSLVKERFSLTKPIDDKERTLWVELKRRVPYDQRNNPPQHSRIVYPPILDINCFHHFLVTLENLYPMDDEPIWAVDRVVAPTLGSVITIPEIANEFAIKGNIIKIFYHGLREITQEVLNATAGGIFLYKTPNQAFQLLEDKVLLKLDCAKKQKTKASLKKTIAFTDEGSSNYTNKIMARMDAITLKMDAQYKELQTYAKKTKPDINEDDIPMSREEEDNLCALFIRLVFTMITAIETRIAIIGVLTNEQSINAFVKETFMDLKTQLETIAKNLQALIQNLETKFDRLADRQSSRPSGSLLSNTQPNPKGHNKTYQPPQSYNEHINAIFTRSGKSYNPPINPNDQQKDSENPINFDSDEEEEEPTPQSKT
uniref:Putative ribonuclease H-like domain-containing protein n=1 Tax=Tanacetum cinerariifolium TaxID=118510 RepID=A0A6L2MZL0_TANCI|nr:putative ribonuclease H-like domain-containing protein [Tanacetum cinerariifolium]